METSKDNPYPKTELLLNIHFSNRNLVVGLRRRLDVCPGRYVSLFFSFAATLSGADLVGWFVETCWKVAVESHIIFHVSIFVRKLIEWDICTINLLQRVSAPLLNAGVCFENIPTITFTFDDWLFGSRLPGSHGWHTHASNAYYCVVSCPLCISKSGKCLRIAAHLLHFAGVWGRPCPRNLRNRMRRPSFIFKALSAGYSSVHGSKYVVVSVTCSVSSN